MKNYLIPLLLHLSLHTLTVAEIHTFKQGDPNSYIGDVSNIPELGPEDIDVKDDGDLLITFGKEISKRLFAAAEEHCKDPESDQCKAKTQEIMGIGPSNNGLQKRVISVAVAVGGPILATAVWKAFTYIWDRLNKSTERKVIPMKISQEQKNDVANWDVANEDKFLYETENGETVEVPINDDEPTSQTLVEIKAEGDGNIAVVLGDIIPAIEQSWNDVRCGQLGMKRSLQKRVTMRELLQCIESIQRLGQIGGPAAGIQEVDPSMFPIFKKKEMLEAFEESKKYSQKLVYSRRLPPKSKENVATVSTWISAAAVMANAEFKDGRMIINKWFLENQEQVEDTDQCLKGNDRVFCVNCGGNAKLDDFSLSDPSNAQSKLGECQGILIGDKLEQQGCECFQDARPMYQEVDSGDMQWAFDFLNGLPDEVDEADPNASKRKQCYKEDEERMTDHTNWKFVQQTVLDETIKKQCDNFKQTGEPGEKEIQDDAIREDFNYAKLKIYEPKPGMFTQEMCHSMFSEISAGCDWSPLEQDSPNQFNWKWGGEIELESGVKASIEPVWSRVWTDGDAKIQPTFSYCDALDKFSDKDYKGNNGATLDDKAKMTLQQCIHQALYLESADNLNCGGLLNMGFHLTGGYKSVSDCWKTNWRCVSWNIEQGQSGRGSHHPGAPDCWLDLMFA